MKLNIAVLPGDGIGPEIIEQALEVTKAVCNKFGHTLTYTKGLVGACAIDATGNPYPDETHELCMQSDAILFGAVGDLRFDNNPAAKVRPEQGLLAMRKKLGLYANIRPVQHSKHLCISRRCVLKLLREQTLCVFESLQEGFTLDVRKDVAKMATPHTTLVYTHAKRLRA